MKRIFIMVLTACTFFVGNAQNADHVKEIIKELSSEKYYGRGYMMDGVNLAAEYIKDEYIKAGLKPVGDDYFQPFNFSINCITALSLKLDDKELKPGVDYVIRRSVETTKGKFNLVHVSDEEWYDLKKMEKLIKKMPENPVIVMEYAHLFYQEEGMVPSMKLLFQQEFKGYIFLQEDDPKDYVMFGNKTSEVFYINIKNNVFSKESKTIELDVTADYREVETKNVMGMVEGKTYPDSIVVICGHYDHLGTMGPDVYYPGADDNASAIATMIEMGAYFSKPENQPERTLVFVSLSGEEAGLYGAYEFVENPPVKKENINYCLNLDMIAFGEKGLQAWNGLNEPDLISELEIINEEYQLFDSLEIKENTPNSDHYAFTEHDISALFLTTGIEASYLYHTVYDTYEKASFEKLEEILKLIRIILEE